MRILLLHSDYIRFKVTKRAIKGADEIEGEGAGEAKETLAVLMASEKTDEKDVDSTISKTVEEIKKVYVQVGAKNITLYPYAHLSSNLSSPDVAKSILGGIYEALKKEGFEIIKAPFGWYKGFEIKCKGHPLSELSRTIVPEGIAQEKDETEALKREVKLKSSWHILTPNGDLRPVDNFDFKEHPSLKKFVDYEISKVRGVDVEPPHVKLMRMHEIADYEKGSDAGNMRWYPKGSMIKRLLEERVSFMVEKYGAMRVETPIMYDVKHPALSKYLNRFPARQYIVKSGEKEFFLRFAACFGQYLMKHDMAISYRHLPVRLYELTHYSFRREQRGELVGLRRLRSFTMPDMHTLVRGMDEAKQEFIDQYRMAMEWMRGIDLNYEVGIRFVREFYEKNKDFAKELVRLVGKPVLVEMWDERPFYFVMKFEFNIIDALNKASALSTVQIDIENTERFGITYTDESDKKVNPLILHASISGGIDRNVYAILEKAYMDQQGGKKPQFPLWLAPTQVRIVPISDNFMKFAESISGKIENEGIRVDIDDRNISMGKKIMEAEKEWVPYIVVVGEKEAKEGTLSVRVRESGGQISMDAEGLAREIKNKVRDMPFKPLPLPRLLSKRPRFV